jgi:hypothetical protein
MNKMKHKPTIEELRAQITKFIQDITPSGMRLMVEYRTPFYFTGDLTLCCDGSRPIEGLYCGRDPDHKGRCHSYNKDTDFNNE